jgi:ketosteroid isomerase-like protein
MTDIASRRFFLLGLAGLGAVSIAPAVAASPADAQVRAALDDFFAKAERRDWDAAGALMGPKFRIWVDGDEQFERAAYIAALKKDDMKMLHMALDDVQIVASGDLAWCSYRATVKAEWGDKIMTTKTAETIVYERIDGQWLMRHCHVSIGKNA